MFSILAPLPGLGYVLAGIRHVRIGTIGFDLRLGDGALIGATMIAILLMGQLCVS